jgi:hypothetical protein
MVFLFLLIGLFAASSLTLTLIGMRVYRDVTARAESNGDAQMLMSYIGNKVHAYDATGGAALAQRGGQTALCLRETIDGTAYETAIYWHDNAVWEWFAPAGEAFDPSGGERLIAARALAFAQLAPGLIEARVELISGEAQATRVALRTAAAGGDAP